MKKHLQTAILFFIATFLNVVPVLSQQTIVNLPSSEVLLNRGLKYTIENIEIKNGFVYIKATVENP